MCDLHNFTAPEEFSTIYFTKIMINMIMLSNQYMPIRNMVTFNCEYFFQSHQFERTFDIHEGYRVPLYGLTDGGYFSCHSQEDENIVADFHVVVHCELR